MVSPSAPRPLETLVAHVRSAAPQLAPAFDLWLRALEERGGSRHTVDAYARDVAQLLTFAGKHRGADVCVGQIDKEVLRGWLRELAQTCVPSTRARKIAAARQFFRVLCKRGELAANPALEILLPKVVRPLPDVLAPDDASAIVEAPVGDGALALRDRAMLEVLYGVGVTVSELCALDLHSVDAPARVLRIVRTKGTRELPLGACASDALSRYLARRHELRSGARPQDPSALFVSRLGRRVGVRRVQTVVHQLGRRALGRRSHPHALRHSFAVVLLDGGADLGVVHKMLGNVSLATTARYGAVAVEQLRRIHRDAHPLGRARAPDDVTGAAPASRRTAPTNPQATPSHAPAAGARSSTAVRSEDRAPCPPQGTTRTAGRDRDRAASLDRRRTRRINSPLSPTPPFPVGRLGRRVVVSKTRDLLRFPTGRASPPVDSSRSIHSGRLARGLLRSPGGRSADHRFGRRSAIVGNRADFAAFAPILGDRPIAPLISALGDGVSLEALEI
jgi:integrase/recombinase XerC